MGFPVTGQGYNLVALSFYIGESTYPALSSRFTHCHSALRLLDMGIPFNVYRATTSAREVPWSEHRRMGRDHDVARHPSFLWPIFCDAVDSRDARELCRADPHLDCIHVLQEG